MAIHSFWDVWTWCCSKQAARALQSGRICCFPFHIGSPVSWQLFWLLQKQYRRWGGSSTQHGTQGARSHFHASANRGFLAWVPPEHPLTMLQSVNGLIRQSRIVLGRRIFVLVPHCMNVSRKAPCIPAKNSRHSVSVMVPGTSVLLKLRWVGSVQKNAERWSCEVCQGCFLGKRQISHPSTSFF